MLGNITNPFCRISSGGALCSAGGQGQGLIMLLAVLIRTAIVIAGVFTLINFILAGYTFLSAGGDPKKVQQAWEKIYISIIGLVVAAGSILLAMLVGWLVFRDPTAIISPQIFTPQ